MPLNTASQQSTPPYLCVGSLVAASAWAKVEGLTDADWELVQEADAPLRVYAALSFS